MRSGGPAAPSPRVWALVVTRDRRALLEECLQALRDQTWPVERIVVLDNASSDGTAEWLARQAQRTDGPAVVLRSDINLGGAGGFAAAVDHGRQGAADWLWLMDDDAAAEPEALRRMMESPAAADPSVVGLGPRVVHPDGRTDLQHRCRMGRFVVPLSLEAYRPGTSADVECASFVGLLVRTRAARATELPRAEFFLGYDDAEWSLRLRRTGSIRLVPDSVVVHKVPIGGGGTGRRARFWNRVLGVEYATAPWSSYWKDLYRVRNLVALQRTHGGATRGSLVVLIAGYAVKTVLYDPGSWRRLPWIVRYAVKGWRGDFRAIPPEAWARRRNRSA